MQAVHALDEIANPLSQATLATLPADGNISDTNQFLYSFQILYTRERRAQARYRAVSIGLRVCCRAFRGEFIMGDKHL